jgi:L-alanine-DL-glutamate epimerase-like enolase superfamily enzyme
MGDKSAEDAAKEAEEAAKRGFKAIKMKGWNAEKDVERIKAVAEAAGPDVQVRIDANTGWARPSDVVKLARQLEGYSIESFESPMPQWNLDAYAMVRQQIDIPIMLHLSQPFEVINAIKKEACDCINFGEVASFRLVRIAAAIAETASIPMELGSGYDFGIGDSATAHIAAATRNVTLPCDLIGNFLHNDDLIVEPITVKDGCIELSEKPGLGIELDEEAVEKYAVAKSSYP